MPHGVGELWLANALLFIIKNTFPDFLYITENQLLISAVVPIDPAAPKERMRFLVESVNAKVVLCSRLHAANLEELADNVIPIDDEFMGSLPAFSGRPEARADSHNAAYIIPTSGTTGQPKLSLIEHGSYCTGTKAHHHAFMMDKIEPLRVLQFAAHSFDASIIEILTPLMVGGVTCIPNESDRLNDIAKVMNEMQVTYAQLTPTFVRFLEPSMVPSLATICLMGEAMSQTNLDTWSKINLINGYV